MKPMQLPDWAWKQAYNMIGDSYNKGQIEWVWCQKVLDRTLTPAEYTHIIAIIQAIDKGLDINKSNPAEFPPEKRI